MHSRLSACLLLLLTGTVAGAAHAHFAVDMGDTHESRYGPGEIKSPPCGRPDGERGEKVHTYKPGEIIDVSWVEFVAHPGYFRIAFDSDGDDDFVNPASIAPAGRACAEGEPNCGDGDFYNNETVLLDDFGRHDVAENGRRYTAQVKLPDVECGNCTLQIIQLMTEESKAPYDPAAEDADDIYYQCVDLRLQANR